jgi:hypothetical protein
MKHKSSLSKECLCRPKEGPARVKSSDDDAIQASTQESMEPFFSTLMKQREDKEV